VTPECANAPEGAKCASPQSICPQPHPEIYRFVVLTLVARLREADEETAAESFMTVRARVARAMLELAQHLGRETESGRITILHKIKQSDIAAMVQAWRAKT
jgi:CRP/FNR family cyclic AMP-dependent transcriptional regulator